MNTSPRFNVNGNAFERVSSPTFDAKVQQRMALVEWINSAVPHFYLSVKASDEELRASLLDGDILSQILQRFKYSSVDEGDDSVPSPESRRRKIQRFTAVMSEMGLPSFEITDLEKGSMRPVLDCLLALKDHTKRNFGSPGNRTVDDRRQALSEIKFQRSYSLLSPESPTMLLHGGNKFQEVFQMKHGLYTDLPATKIQEMMKSNSLDNAPTQSLLSVINGILDESIERKNAEIPQRVACLLRKVVQEIERRIATQGEHLRTQSNLFKSREEKYQSRIKVLETLAKGTSEESEIALSQLQHLKSERSKMDENKRPEQKEMEEKKKGEEKEMEEKKRSQQKMEEKKKLEEQEMEEKKRLEEQEMEEKKRLKEQEMEEKKRLKEQEMEEKKRFEQILKEKKRLEEQEVEEKKRFEQILEEKKRFEQILEEKKRFEEQEASKLKKLKEETSIEVSVLKQELEMAKKTHELRFKELEGEAKQLKSELEKKLRQQDELLEDSKVKMKELEFNSQSKSQIWAKKEHTYEKFMHLQLSGLQDLRRSSVSIKQGVLDTQKTYLQELNHAGAKLKNLAKAAQNYHTVLNENRKLYNELQDLKGNIRVFCRVRPFQPGENKKQTILDEIGENGELTVTNPAKPQEASKAFKFNKVYGPKATQAEVFCDTQPLIRTILDGYNVCIFAYGQTGSGKTYTMSGPDNATKEDWGVNYRALDDLFQVSEDRKNFFLYEIGVQMIEIYNEQIRDLLSNDGSQKKLGILTTPQSHGLAVPDASMHPVKSTEDVIELMNIGLGNRSVSATSMNQRSSRSHSIVTIHVQGTELKSGATTHGSLHLVDLAGSERVDRSEVTGDRLKEAQHINKSLSSLGDVIFALAQKSPHVPYRNSKLTQVLQTSLGGRAKTLMFVQMNPDVSSYSETLSTLKFAERVSGVELGAARNNKDGNVKELMDQVASLKEAMYQKDEEIDRLLKDPRSPSAASMRNTSSLKPESSSPSNSSLRSGPSSPSARSIASSPRKISTVTGDDGIRSSSSLSDLKGRKNSPGRQSKLSAGTSMDDDMMGMDDADDDRLSETSDTEANLSPEQSKSSDTSEKRKEKPKTPTRLAQSPRTPTGASRLSQVKTTLRATSALKKPASGSSSPVTPGRRRV
ncbi:kinesin-like protein KIN-14C [Silene latifolia]|uniref:kinesin-like protein KIN-14C n=1 Tax=Silene latifolia TaxID=37657 RepID=UPI003D77C41D